MESIRVRGIQNDFPLVGFGTYKIEDNKAIRDALGVGYRLFDCASAYGNQHLIGPELRHIPREELIISSKVWPNALSRGCPAKSATQTVKDLKCEYLDLLLVHWPIVFQESTEQFPLDPKTGNVLLNDDYPLTEVWREFLQIRDSGLVKAVGVSNFNQKQLISLEESGLELPAVNQIESHPLLTNQELIQFCQQKDIQIMAFCPLARGQALQLDSVKRLADKYGVSCGQVCLRWGTQRKTCVIPKSSSLERMRENFDLFSFRLTEEEIKQITNENKNQRISPFNKFGVNLSKNYPF